jgi:hypothetical protein
VVVARLSVTGDNGAALAAADQDSTATSATIGTNNERVQRDARDAIFSLPCPLWIPHAYDFPG